MAEPNGSVRGLGRFRGDAAHKAGMKMYATDPNLTFTSPRERALLGDERHNVQAQMYVVAKTKKAAVGFLIAVGERSHIAVSLMRRARVLDDTRPADARAAVAAGVIDPDSPGAYLFSRNRGNGVVSLTVDGPVRVATEVTRSGSDADRFRIDTPGGSR